MNNDNASRQVIDMTMSDALSYVRFYFRPLTPTQYYNEGFKHSSLRYDDNQNANVPLPIFFAFNLEKLLLSEQVVFSNFSQAGYGSPVFHGLDDFSQLEFEKIYSHGVADKEIIDYRHAEILYPNEYDIDDSLEAILCRNEIEKTTFLTLIMQNDQKAYYKYRDKIKICKDMMFEKNGLFIDEINYNNNILNISFADTHKKKVYENTQMLKNGLEILDKINSFIILEWKNANSILLTKNLSVDIDYINPKPIILKLPVVDRAKSIILTITMEDKIIAKIKKSLSESKII